MLLVSSAFALELVTLPGGAADASAIAPVVSADGLGVALLGDGLRVVDAASGDLLWLADVTSTAMTVRDGDADGDDEVWLCGPDGLVRAEQGAYATALDTPCTAVVGQAILASGVAVLGDSLKVYAEDGTGGLGAPWDLGLTADVLGSTGVVLAGNLGDPTFGLWDTLGVTEVDALGTLVAFAPEGYGWVIDDAVVIDGMRIASTSPRALVLADIDGDTLSDAFVLHDDAIGVVLGTDGVEELWPTTARAIAAADVDLDGFDDVLVLGDTSWWTLVVVEAGSRADGDGDGYTPAEGDCDDARADVHPAATETCDGTDEDCSGGADDGLMSFEIVSESPVSEGTYVPVHLVIEGCPGDIDITWSWTGPGTCDDGIAGSCRVYDEGTFSVTAEVTDADGALVDEVSASIHVRNVDPTFPETVETGGCGSTDTVDDGYLLAHVGDVVEVALHADDPGRDTLTFSVEGAPPGLDVTPEGLATWTVTSADKGVWVAVVTVSDGDGGEDSREVTIEVPGDGRSAPGSGICCTGWSAMILVGLFRMRRPRPRVARDAPRTTGGGTRIP